MVRARRRGRSASACARGGGAAEVVVDALSVTAIFSTRSANVRKEM
jgi:hypothetical protein